MDSTDGWFGPKPQYKQNKKTTFFLSDEYPTAMDLWFTTEGLETMPTSTPTIVKPTQLSRSNISTDIIKTFPFTEKQLQSWATTLSNNTVTNESYINNIFDPKIVVLVKANEESFKTGFLGSDLLGITDRESQASILKYYLEMDAYFTNQDNILTTGELNKKRKLAIQDASITYKSQYLNLFNIVIGVLIIICLIYILMRTTIQPAIDAAKNNASGAGSVILGSIKGVGNIAGKIFSGIREIPGRIMSLFGKKTAAGPEPVAGPVAGPVVGPVAGPVAPGA